MPASRARALLALAPSVLAQDWTNLGGNAERNGQSPAVGPASVQELWSNTDDFSIIAWTPFVADGRVFTVRESAFPQGGGPAGDALVAYDLDSGAELWRRTLDFGGDPATEWIAWIAGARDGRVYASRSAHLKPQPMQAFDAATGEPTWTSALATQAFAYDGVVFAQDGDLYVGDWINVARIDAEDGSTVWSATRSCPFSGNCGVAASENGVYIDQPAPGGQVVTKLDPATGAELYSSDVMPGFTDQNAPFLAPGARTVYFSRTQNNPDVDELYAFGDTGAALVTRWHRPVRWTTSHEHGIGLDGSIYTFTPSDELVRLDPATGNVMSSAGVLAPLGGPNASPKTAVDALGRVYVSNGWGGTPASYGRLWAFEADLGTSLFTLDLDRQNNGGPALAARGTLVVADRTGVRAYREEGPLGTPFCVATPTSCGGAASISAFGSEHLANKNLVLSADGVPDQPGIFFFGTSEIQVPFGNGFQCVGGGDIDRLPVVRGSGCRMTCEVDFAARAALGLGPGTWKFQAWFRDPAAGGSAFNLSDGLSVTLY